MGSNGKLSTMYSNLVPLQIQFNLQWLLKTMSLKEKLSRNLKDLSFIKWKVKKHCTARRTSLCPHETLDTRVYHSRTFL